MEESEPRRLPAVEKALQAARGQLTRDRQALEARFGEVLALRSYAVVAVDLERMLGEEV